MKKNKSFVVLIFVIIFIFINSNITTQASDIATEGPDITARSAYVIDNNSNKVIFSKNENVKMQPASTTKIMTAIIVIENCNLDDVVTASYNAVMSIPDGYSTADIEINEQLTVEQLLELLLVCSANDAANILAEFTGGSIDSFVSMMNTKVNDLNLLDTHFTNTFGMDDENHYTTAHDLAYIFKYCLQNDTFRKLAGKASCAIPATNLHEPRSYVSTNELIVPESDNYYKYSTAGKTGYTSQAKECLVSSAYKDDLGLIVSVLGSDSRFTDSRRLYDFAYSNYSIQVVANENDVVTTIDVPNAKYDSKSLDLLISKDIMALLNNSVNIADITPDISLNDNISAPIYEGTVLGTVTYNIDGISYKANLIASHSVEKSKLVLYSLYAIAGVAILILFVRILFRGH